MNVRNRRINILFVISSLANEGPTRVLLNVVRYINREKFCPTVMTLVDEKESSLKAEFADLDVAVFELSPRTVRSRHEGFMSRVMKLRKIISSEDFDIVHGHCPRALFYIVAAAPRSLKTAYTVHIYPPTQFPSLYGPAKGALFSAAANVAIRFVCHPVACSDSVAREYLDEKNYRIKAINNGIDPLVPVDYVRARDEQLLKLGMDPSCRYLVYVGRLSPEKRIAEFAELFARICGPDCKLIVVGGGSEEERIRRIGGSIVCLGYQSQVLEILLACDIYVSPSSTEGLANSLLEAMSVGLPCLLSDIPSHRAVMERVDGSIGFLFNPESESDITQKLAILQEWDVYEVERNIRKMFIKNYHAKAMTKNYEDLYLSIFQ